MGDWLKKYIAVFRISLQNSLVYRLSFLMFQGRSIITFFTLYLFWHAAYRHQHTIYTYPVAAMLTYTIVASALRSIVLESQNTSVSYEIASGQLNSYLLKPLNYFTNWWTRDIANKALNIIFLTIELGLFFLIIKPPFLIPGHFNLLMFLISVILGIFIFFYTSLIISVFTFWYPEHNGWPIRFLFLVVTSFLSGGIIPLDLIPAPIYVFIKYLPTSYFIFVPLQIFLGRLSEQTVITQLLIMVFWALLLKYLVSQIWKKGLQRYHAVGI